MQIHISTSDGVPIYLQIVNQVKYLVAAGGLEAGEELPPIRVLAERLGSTRTRWRRAYRELEADGRGREAADRRHLRLERQGRG